MLKVLLSAFICTIGDLWERSGTRSAPKFPLLALKWVGGKSVLNPSPPIAPFDAQTALIMNLIDPPDTSSGYISRQGVREDHSDPTRTINLAKWVVTAPYTDENEEISPPNKKFRTLTVNR